MKTMRRNNIRVVDATLAGALFGLVSSCANHNETAVSAELATASEALEAESAASQHYGEEVSVNSHLANGDEFELSTEELIKYGKQVFTAKWTIEEGGGRPLTKGSGPGVSDPSSPLIFPRNFNRVSGPDANSCAGCHNDPIIGAGGDRAAVVFVTGQRFDFATFDQSDTIPTRGTFNEAGQPTTLQNIANERKSVGMPGSGFIEMLSRQMTAELRTLRDAVAPGATAALVAKGVSFGTLARLADGRWDTSQVKGLAAPSLASANASSPPSLTVMPFHQAGANVSVRQFTVTAFNHHHGVQAQERFGTDTDPDGDGFTNELTIADITAATVFQVTLGVPQRITPKGRKLRDLVARGEQKFASAGCADCHVPALPLTDNGWVYTEPNPYNPAGNLRPGDAATLSIDLTDEDLPGHRLSKSSDGKVWVPAYTDMKLHDITSGPNDPGREPIDQNQPAGSAGFLAGNARFMTARLWGVANSGPYMHHGKFTTMREAILAHDGEALYSRQAFESLSEGDRDAVIEFLKTMRVKN